ncbi:cupin [Candidatus Shapirobacteria bacterium CG10_big_fil_rev_8_21_14_0_10_38_14]|uniref:Cupin n=1 Tax=Candidatus Shapirobacteria bacterium CG10_big_fil_rev_8_21_14_0_10_38_14 TaxID=1974483 RepID=A0A2M8L670_9BACT|nr:MAG: cupin [Candidatus Shapirobacteria bacterium CG10_big_fil_rev_8_21_14_0_10_38_14]
MIAFQVKTEKPWGYEILFTPPESQTIGKLLHINAGARFSLQYHEVKEETLTLMAGESKIIWGENENDLKTENMKKNHGYFIPKRLIHRCEAVSDCDIFESSTKEEGTTVRLQDDYTRKNETEEERQQTRN